MTWAELVAAVDAALAAAGKGREIEIDYIDVGTVVYSGLEIFVDDDGLTVTS